MIRKPRELFNGLMFNKRIGSLTREERWRLLIRVARELARQDQLRKLEEEDRGRK